MKKKKKYFVFTVCMVFISTILFSLFSFAWIQIPNYPTIFNTDVKTNEPILVVVPGAKITTFGVGYALEERLYTAQSIYHNNPNVTIFLSGAYDTEEKKHEADVMLDYLRRYAVAVEDIILDYEGNSTIDSITHIKAYDSFERMYICTQEMYIPRTMYLAKKHKVNAIAIQSDKGLYKHNYFMACVREYLACSKAILQTLFI